MKITSHHINFYNRINYNNNKNIEKSKMQTKNTNGDVILNLSIEGINKSKRNLTYNKTNKVLEGLMEQRENLLQYKNDTMTNMIEKGQSPNLIAERMKDIDKQLKTIDEQIKEVQLEEQRKNMGLDKENDKKEEEVESSSSKDGLDTKLSSNKINSLISSNKELDQIKTISSVRKTAEGSARILKKEIELDEGRSLSGKAGLNKYIRYEKLDDRISSLTEDFYEKASGINNKITLSSNKEVKNTRINKEENYNDIKDTEHYNKKEINVQLNNEEPE